MTTYNPPFYSYGIIDTVGVATSNNFLSLFNPSSSTVTALPTEAGITCYALTTAQVAGSMAAYRISAASGGTLVTSSDVNKFRTVNPTPVCEVRTGNPTVTRVNSTPLLFKSPSVNTGGGNSGTVDVRTTALDVFSLKPGEGIVFNTAAGDTDHIWNLVLVWAERRN